MNTSEIDQVSKALDMLRKSNAMHVGGDSEKAIGLEREARLILAFLLESNGVETDQASHLAQSRQTLAAGLLSLAKKEITVKDMNKLIKDTKSATKKTLAHAREAK